MNLIRNFIGVIIGLVLAATIITVGITIDHRWFSEVVSHEINSWQDVYTYWRQVLVGAREEFFIGLFISFCIGSLLGGIVTALIVTKAKPAYAMLVGLILSIVAYIEVLIIPNHPFWYKIAIWFAFFPFAWMGSKIIEQITNNKN